MINNDEMEYICMDCQYAYIATKKGHFKKLSNIWQ